jgi:hypothetical protein
MNIKYCCNIISRNKKINDEKKFDKLIDNLTDNYKKNPNEELCICEYNKMASEITKNIETISANRIKLLEYIDSTKKSEFFNLCEIYTDVDVIVGVRQDNLVYVINMINNKLNDLVKYPENIYYLEYILVSSLYEKNELMNKYIKLYGMENVIFLF